MTCAPSAFIGGQLRSRFADQARRHHTVKVYLNNLKLQPRTARRLRLMGFLAIRLSSRKWRNPWDESYLTKFPLRP